MIKDGYTATTDNGIAAMPDIVPVVLGIPGSDMMVRLSVFVVVQMRKTLRAAAVRGDQRENQ